jgi:hypothetical protein
MPATEATPTLKELLKSVEWGGERVMSVKK